MELAARDLHAFQENRVGPRSELGLSANDLVKAFGAPVNGRGGGKAELAQGSGGNAGGIDAALAAVRAEVQRS